MSSNFFSLPCELRDRIYKLVLLHQDLIDPWDNYDQRQKHSPQLLHVNRTIYREASPLFYAHNRFDFTMGTSEDIASFLEHTGRNNADSIRHLCIEFPMFLHLDRDTVTLEDDSAGILASIQSRCANLRTLTTARRSTSAMALELDALDNPEVVTEALKLVNTHFRAISSLQEIIIEFYEGGPGDDIRRKVESHGWTINVEEYVEEEDSDIHLSYSGYYDQVDDDDDGDYHDQGDIPNLGDDFLYCGD